MPHKPLKPCKYPGCPKLTAELYCEDHRGIMDKNYNKYTRSSEHNKRYGRSWKEIRNRFLAANPLCACCIKEGRLTPATLVHHILPVERGGGNEESNLMSLCASCHEKIHHELGDK